MKTYNPIKLRVKNCLPVTGKSNDISTIMVLSLGKIELQKTKKILDQEGSYLNDNCIEMSLIAMDTNEAREKFLIITEVSRQLPFNKKPECINIDRIESNLRKYMKSKFLITQEAILIIYNRPPQYFAERDNLLQDVPRPHWFVLCISFTQSNNYKIKIIDSWYQKNMRQKENVKEEAGLYLSMIIKIFIQLKGTPTDEIRLTDSDFNIIASNKQNDEHSCGDYSIEAIRCIIENRTWVKTGKNDDQKKLKELDTHLTRWRIKNIADTFYQNYKGYITEKFDKYNIEKNLRNSGSPVLSNCAKNDKILGIDGMMPLFKKKELDKKQHKIMSCKEKAEMQLAIAKNYENYLISYINFMKKRIKKQQRRIRLASCKKKQLKLKICRIKNDKTHSYICKK